MIGQRTNVYTSMFLLVFVCHKRARNGASRCACAGNGSGKCKIRCCTNSLQTEVYSNVFCSFVLGLFGTNLIVKRRKKKRERMMVMSRIQARAGTNRMRSDNIGAAGMAKQHSGRGAAVGKPPSREQSNRTNNRRSDNARRSRTATEPTYRTVGG